MRPVGSHLVIFPLPIFSCYSSHEGAGVPELHVQLRRELACAVGGWCMHMPQTRQGKAKLPVLGMWCVWLGDGGAWLSTLCSGWGEEQVVGYRAACAALAAGRVDRWAAHLGTPCHAHRTGSPSPSHVPQQCSSFLPSSCAGGPGLYVLWSCSCPICSRGSTGQPSSPSLPALEYPTPPPIS